MAECGSQVQLSEILGTRLKRQNPIVQALFGEFSKTVLALEGFLLVPQTVLALEGFLLAYLLQQLRRTSFHQPFNPPEPHSASTVWAKNTHKSKELKSDSNLRC